jgi:non-ribosomal peptide synthetase component F
LPQGPEERPEEAIMFDLERLKSLSDITRVQAHDRPGEIAQVFEDRVTTFAELDTRASRIANGLAALGVKPQARIGYIGMNSDRYFEVISRPLETLGLLASPP